MIFAKNKAKKIQSPEVGRLVVIRYFYYSMNISIYAKRGKRLAPQVVIYIELYCNFCAG